MSWVRARGLGLHLDLDDAKDPELGGPFVVHASPAADPDELRRLRADQALSISVHDDTEATWAHSVGAALVLWGHVLATPSKSGRPGRGFEALKSAAKVSPLPLIAVGGLDLSHEEAVRASGAAGLAAIRAPFADY